MSVLRISSKLLDFGRLLTDQMDAHLKHLEERIRQFVIRLRHHAAHLEALEFISEQLWSLSSAPTPDASAPYLQQENHHSPRKTAVMYSFKNTMPEQSGVDLTEPSHRQLLGALGCPPLHVPNLHTIPDTLDSLSYERSQTAKKTSKHCEAMIDILLASYLSNADCTTGLISEVMLQHTPYQTVQLLDEQLRLRIAALEVEVNEIGLGMEALPLNKLSMPGKERDEFVNRWDS